MRPLLFGDCWVLSLSIWGHRAIYGFCFEKRLGSICRVLLLLHCPCQQAAMPWTWVFQLILLLQWNRHSRTPQGPSTPQCTQSHGTPKCSWELILAHHLCTLRYSFKHENNVLGRGGPNLRILCFVSALTQGRGPQPSSLPVQSYLGNTPH